MRGSAFALQPAEDQHEAAIQVVRRTGRPPADVAATTSGTAPPCVRGKLCGHGCIPKKLTTDFCPCHPGRLAGR